MVWNDGDKRKDPHLAGWIDVPDKSRPLYFAERKLHRTDKPYCDTVSLQSIFHWGPTPDKKQNIVVLGERRSHSNTITTHNCSSYQCCQVGPRLAFTLGSIAAWVLNSAAAAV